MINPEISLIMPVYNSEKYIKDAIESILNQTFTNFELLLIIDCPTDGTLNVIKNIKDNRIRCFYNKKNSGIAYSRNIGLFNAQGKYIALMDHDDISTPGRFAEQVSFLDDNRDIDFVGGRFQEIDSEGKVIRESNTAYKNPLFIKALLLFQNIFSNGEMMFRKDIVEQHKIRYASNQFGMEDFKFWIECSKVGRFTTIDNIFLQHRVYDESETQKNKKEHWDEREMHRRKLQRYSLELSKIKVSEEEMEILHSYTNNKLCTSKEELRKYYCALRTVVQQSGDLDFGLEVDILCRKYMAKQIRAANRFWEYV